MNFAFVGFRNRDTGEEDWVNVRSIFRVMPCPNPEHAGFALIWLTEKDDKGHPWVLEADETVEEFMEKLRMADF